MSIHLFVFFWTSFEILLNLNFKFNFLCLALVFQQKSPFALFQFLTFGFSQLSEDLDKKREHGMLISYFKSSSLVTKNSVYIADVMINITI